MKHACKLSSYGKKTITERKEKDRKERVLLYDSDDKSRATAMH